MLSQLGPSAFQPADHPLLVHLSVELRLRRGMAAQGGPADPALEPGVRLHLAAARLRRLPRVRPVGRQHARTRGVF